MTGYPCKPPMRKISVGVYEFGWLGDDPLYRVEKVRDGDRFVWMALERVGSSWSWVSTRATMRVAVSDVDALATR